MKKRIDITGHIFNDIYVFEYLETRNTHSMYNCICMICGNTLIVSYSNLLSGNTKSCRKCCNKKLNYKQECEIQQRLTEGEKAKDIANEYKIDRRTIYKIKNIKGTKSMKKETFLKEHRKGKDVISKIVAGKISALEPDSGFKIQGTVTEARIDKNKNIVVSIQDHFGNVFHNFKLDSISIENCDESKDEIYEQRCSKEAMKTALLYADELFKCNYIQVAVREKWVYLSTENVNSYVTCATESDANSLFIKLKEHIK